MHTRGFAAFLLESLIAAEFDAGAPLGFSALEAGALEIVGTALDMRAQLILHLRVHLGTVKKSGDAETKRIEKFHISPACAASAAPMAVASRFQLSVSSRRRLRPAVVSS